MSDARGPARFLFGDDPKGRRLLAELRRLQRRELPEAEALPEPDAACELCGKPMERAHRHLIRTVERRIVCACESCWALRAGETDHRPVGTRLLWLDALALPDALWRRLGVPIGLAFFLRSSSAGRVIALYPGPAGATEAEPPADAWEALVEANPVLRSLEADAEALVVSRLEGAEGAGIAPIDRCYELVGRIRSAWEGLTGGPALRECVPEFLAALRRASGTP